MLHCKTYNQALVLFYLYFVISFCFPIYGFYRLDDAIEILDYVVGMREEKLGTANPDVDDERRRLSELLKEAGRARNRKSRSLVTLLDNNPEIMKDDGIEV